jgi:hypothetical protein
MHGMRWKFQDAGGRQTHSGDPKRPDKFFNFNDFLVLPKEDQIDRKQHPNGMDAARRHNPKSVPKPGPFASLAQETD